MAPRRVLADGDNRTPLPHQLGDFVISFFSSLYSAKTVGSRFCYTQLRYPLFQGERSQTRGPSYINVVFLK